MDKSKDDDIAVFAIKPIYANAIISGEKTVEFRRNGAPSNITHMVVYSTSPDKKVLGICDVTKCITASPQSLWRRFGSNGRISRKDFFIYFEGVSSGKCYLLKKTKKFIRPILLKSCWSFSKSPQSFVYIEKKEWIRLKKKKTYKMRKH
jgi:predicted transcriptional regulator